MTFLEKVKQHITENALLEYGDSVLVAVSGGADSVCLLDALCALKEELSLSIFVAHVNHGLRGKEADRDETFVKTLSENYGLPYYLKKANVKNLAKQKKCSTEEAGRHVRYSFFNEIREKYGIKKLATAHNKNDNVETVCMRFMRGTGILGLAGIPVKTNSGIIRPLLPFSRDEIEEYLFNKGLSYVTDSSNLEDEFTRNRIRHNLIPYILKNHNENFIDTLSKEIDGFCEASTFLETCALNFFHTHIKKEPFGYSATCEDLKTADVYLAKSVILKTLRQLTEEELTREHVASVFALLEKENCSVSVKRDVSVYVCYGKLFFVKEKDFTLFSLPLSLGKTTLPTGAVLTCEDVDEKNTPDNNTIYFPRDVNLKDFTIRSRLPGDKMTLPNLGHKKIKDILIDEKIPVILRDKIPVVLYKNEIIWLCGIRKSADLSDASDARFLKITYSEEKNNA